MRTVAVVLAGGSGLRLGGTVPKQLQLLAGRTLLEHSVSAFQQAPGVERLVVVLPAEFVAEGTRLLGSRYSKLTEIIAGGIDRPGSTLSAIELLSGDGPSAADFNVLFHDAARPLVDQRIIADCVAALADCQAVGVVVPTADTIVEVAGGVMTSIPPRESLARCQTPQGFRLSVIRRAYQLAAADPDAAGFSATDDCGIVLRYLPDVKIRAIPGTERNLKITYPGDLKVAESFLAATD
ncbi:MAG TPA: IspD/TarI family cytidylyltransferase [Streptosporangiaceae bacterium]|nr:IspD/TarI family cytidylyltransferase [Streptosporangiaceae bacterium]